MRKIHNIFINSAVKRRKVVEYPRAPRVCLASPPPPAVRSVVVWTASCSWVAWVAAGLLAFLLPLVHAREGTPEGAR